MVVVAGLVPCAESGTRILTALGVAAVQVVLAHDQHAGQLAVRAGRGLQGDGSEAADLGQIDLQLEQELHRTLGHLRILQGVQVGEAGQAGRLLVDLGVVLHGARPQRVEGGVDGHVLLAQAHEVAHHVELAQLRQRQFAGRAQVSIVGQRRGRHVQHRQQRAMAAW
jgi:hypothetical protein